MPTQLGFTRSCKVRFKLLGVEFCVSFWFLVALAIMLSIDIMGLFYIFFISMVIHELSHLVFFRFFGLKVNKIVLSGFGITMVPQNNMYIGYKKEILCYLAGPISNFFLAIFAYFFYPPTFLTRAFIAANLVIAIFNLIPIVPLDGGRVLSTLLLLFFSQKTTSIITSIVAFLSLSPLYLISIYIFFKQHNPAAIVSCIFLTIALLSGKSY